VWSSYVEFQAQTYYSLFLSSEGVLRIQKRHTYGLLGYYWLKAGGKNGVDLDGTLSYWVPNASELPDLKTFCSSLKERLETVQELKGAKRLRSYSGPVLLSAKPAGLLVHEVLGHRVESSRLLSDEEGHTFADKLGEKVTHPDLVIYDDPTATEFAGTSLVGHYQFDDEGVDAGKAQLIDKGTLTGYLCTRSPIAHQNPDAANQQNTAKHQSTGHARNESFQRPIARMANLFILPEGGLPFAELKKEFIDVLKKAGRKYGLWILDVEGGETGTESYDFQAFKGEVLLAKKIHIDGSEEWVRGVDLVGTPLSSLSAITRLGKELEVDNGFCGAESGTIPVSTISPAMIVQKLELQSKEQRRAQLPVTSIPWQT
jgi:predicted Zn-dependent protease